MKKAGVFVLFSFMLVVFFLATALAEENLSYSDKAYACLENKVLDKCSTLTFSDQVFSLLALGYNSEILSQCKNSIMAKSKNDGECWPSPTCNLKDTALAILALNRINQDTKKAEEWISKNNVTSSELEWYLEIDSSSAVNCTISYDSKTVKIKIDDNKKISSFSDTCLTPAAENNWMKISQSCLKKKFEVTCSQSFVSTLLYKKPSSLIWRVSPSVQSASAGGKTTHEISFYCYTTANSCNYEENLWATLALQMKGYDIKGATPYIIAMSEDNRKYFPETFLYLILATEDYLKTILDYQKPDDGYWDLDNKKFYNTAEALLAIPESDARNFAKSWLEDNQDSSGCWGGISDTGFLLWAGWPKPTASGEPGTNEMDCEVAGNYYCMSAGNCNNLDGNILNQFTCLGRSGIQVCCDKQQVEETCSGKGGIVCPYEQICSISTIPASGTSECCLGTCSNQQTECEQNLYSCTSSCLSTEEEVNYACNSGKVCCKDKPIVPVSGKSYWWIYLLIILIILIVLAILFRNRLTMFFFKRKGNVSSSQVNKTRPPFFPPAPMMRKPAGVPYFPAKPPVRQTTKTDKDLDDTFSKLREMSK